MFFGFFGFVVVEAGYPDPHEHEPFNLKYYGGHTPGPSKYEEEKLGELDSFFGFNLLQCKANNICFFLM